MNTKINIDTKKLNIEKETLELVLNDILSDYTEFDIKLMKKYIETKNLDESNFVNI